MFCAVVQDTNEKTGGVKLWRNLPYAEAIRRKEERREELFNRSMEGGYGGVFGPFFVCALEEDHFGSLTAEQMETYKKKFRMAELLIGAKGNTPITLKVEPRQKAQVPDRDKKSKKRER